VKIAPYGTWTSPLTAAAIASGNLRLGAVQIDGEDIYWLEGRPQEGGRYALLRRRPDGTVSEVSPADFNVRTRVHEYGGGAYIVRKGTVYAVDFSDQRVYRITGSASGSVEPLTPGGGWRYCDFDLDTRRQRLICVREDHTEEGREAINTIVSIPLRPATASARAAAGKEVGYDAPNAENAGEVLVSGYDFYSTPRLSPDGSTLAWLSWRHPYMPWDGTELWVADVDASGAVGNATHVAGSTSESIYQPGWSPDGVLYYVSDRTGWWQLYRSDRSDGSNRWDRSDRAVIKNPPGDAEFGRPEWIFGTATWAFAGPSRLVVSYVRLGRWHLALVDAKSGEWSPLAPELQPHDWIAANQNTVAIVAGSETHSDRVVCLDLETGEAMTIREASTQRIDPGYLSTPETIEFPTAGGRTAHAFYYAPRNKDFTGPAGEYPPLVAISHGGPTAAAEPTLHLEIQYWTSRGFALVDVNYGGSAGYGRAYRERLNGQWGIVDVVDVIRATEYLCNEGRGDARRLIIRGGSAGGYTTLAALTFHAGVFKAGASYYGISDLEVLELDTHKFESRYSHSLVGPYPEARDVYRARSPIHAIDRLACPLILFQGLEDKIVPPNQSQMMADAVGSKGLPVAYLAFEGEQHGFRRAETIVRCLEAELYFYGKVFGFDPADRIEPVAIRNA
jgi:dipeptidyl aminopeptidase/acylaminoacyl peptidase